MVIRCKSPVVPAALVCAAVIYLPLLSGGRFKTRGAAFDSLIPASRLTALSGVVASEPVKTAAFGGTYRAAFVAEGAEGADGERSAAFGSIPLYLPQSVVEAHYPGRLHSRAADGSAVLAERGERLFVRGRLASVGGSTAFVATSARSGGFGGSLVGRLLRFRACSRLGFKRLMYAWGDAGALMLALLSGSREYLADGVQEAFVGAGLSHVLALSGMHLTLVALLAGGAARTLSTRRIADAAQLLCVLSFTWFAGASPSLFRALLCALLSCACSQLHVRRPPLATALCAVFLVHAAVFPEHLYAAAFALSYGALFGIALLSRPFARCFARALPPALSEELSASCAAQLATAPVSALLFRRIMPVGAVSSVAVAPLVTGFLYAALFGIALCLALPACAEAVGAAFNGWYALIIACVRLFALAPAITLS